MIKSERLNLVPIVDKDIEWLRETRNRYRDHFFDAHEITKDQQKAWYAKYKDTPTDQMFIVTLRSGEKIGTIALYNINISSRTATLGRVLLLDDFRGYGYAEEMVKALLSYAVDTMRLFKLKVECHLDNIDAVAIYARAGFKASTRPIILLEYVNQNIDWNKPVKIGSYDDLNEDGYESQCSNIKAS